MFSPWYASARRKGKADPLDHVSVNAILYSPGGKYWAMTERGRQSLERTQTTLRIGKSGLNWTGEKLVIAIDEWTVPIPRRLRGTITLDPGSLFEKIHTLDPNGLHRWRPVAPMARVEVAFEKPALHWSGHAYCDMNAGDEPLENGFSYWTWSRASGNGATSILYDVLPRRGERRVLALDYRSDGMIAPFDAPAVAPLPTPGWGVRRETRSDGGERASVMRTFENTPFYTRSLISHCVGGKTVSSIHESVDLDRFRSRWVQTLLPFKMPRITRSGFPSSQPGPP